MKNFIVQSGNNMPLHSPLIPTPFVPYECKNNSTLFAICRVDEEVIRKILEPTPFEYVNDYMVISISDFSNCDKAQFMDSAMVISVRHKGSLGGYYIFEYENNDAAIAAGRDLWGYPKKYADITMSKEDHIIKGKASKDNVPIIQIECDLNSPIENLPDVQTTPHLNIHMVPSPDSSDVFSKRIISRDTSPDFELHRKVYGATKIKLQSSKTEPLSIFESIEVLGGGLIEGDFYATEENGWGKTIEVII